MLSEIDRSMQRMEDLSARIDSWIAQVEPDNHTRRPFGSDGEQTFNSIAVSGAHLCGAEHILIGEIIDAKIPTHDAQAEITMITSNHNELFHHPHPNSKETREILTTLTPKSWKDLARLTQKNHQ